MLTAQLCPENQHWQVHHCCGPAVSSYGSRFTLSMCNRHERVCRRHGDSSAVDTCHDLGVSAMVREDRTDLHLLADSTLNAVRYHHQLVKWAVRYSCGTVFTGQLHVVMQADYWWLALSPANPQISQTWIHQRSCGVYISDPQTWSGAVRSAAHLWATSHWWIMWAFYGPWTSCLKPCFKFSLSDVNWAHCLTSLDLQFSLFF